jgi:hypothetical protein
MSDNELKKSKATRKAVEEIKECEGMDKEIQGINDEIEGLKKRKANIERQLSE